MGSSTIFHNMRVYCPPYEEYGDFKTCQCHAAHLMTELRSELRAWFQCSYVQPHTAVFLLASRKQIDK